MLQMQQQLLSLFASQRVASEQPLRPVLQRLALSSQGGRDLITAARQLRPALRDEG
jgi:hypothetical protein